MYGAEMKQKKVNSKKIVCLISGVVLTIIAVALFAGNNENPDYQNYYNMYMDGGISFEDGLLKTALSFLFMKLGMPYQVFFAMLSAICIFLIWNTINYYSAGNSLVFLLYLIYPFFLDIVQIDNTIAYSIVLNALRFLDDKNKRRGATKYICVVLVAALFHPIALIYLIFLLKYVSSEKMFMFMGAGIFVCLFGFSSILPKIIQCIPVLNLFSVQLGYYVSFASEFGLNLQSGMFKYLVISISVYLFCLFKYRELKKNNMDGRRDKTMVQLFFLLIVLLPLITVSSEFTRIVRNMWILYYCFLLKPNVVKKKYVFILGAITLSVFLFFHDLGPGSYYFEKVTKSILENNIIYQLIG